MTHMNDAMFGKWRDLLAAWHVDPTAAQPTFEDIEAHHAEWGRSYHTFPHVESVLATVDRIADQAKNPNAVRLAVWLHDVICDSRANDNEERSADYARDLCKQLAIPDAERVATLILATKSHQPGDDDADAVVLIDADLSIFGADPVVYRKYSEDIRREYSWVPVDDYRIGRRRVLEKFLERRSIYRLLRELETPARRNIADELAGCRLLWSAAVVRRGFPPCSF